MSKAKGFDSRRFKKILIICTVFIVVVLTCTTFLILRTPQVKFLSRPGQQASVEVVGKRIDRRTTSGGGGSGISTIFSYRISFQFPDGTVKELEVDKFSLSGVQEAAPYSFIYDGIHEGDAGTLTYKELDPAGIERWGEISGRKFICFEQDAEYGGRNFYPIDRDRKNKIIAMGFCLLMLSAVVFFIVCLWITLRKTQKAKEEWKLEIRERAEQQAAWQRQQSQEERQRRQAQEEQQQKRKRQKQRQKRQRKKQKK